MTRRSSDAALLVIGVLLFLTALAADGLGLGGHPGLGYKQLIGAVVGVVLAAVGIVRLRRDGG